jgi:hypothetical protein
MHTLCHTLAAVRVASHAGANVVVVVVVGPFCSTMYCPHGNCIGLPLRCICMWRLAASLLHDRGVAAPPAWRTVQRLLQQSSRLISGFSSMACVAVYSDLEWVQSTVIIQPGWRLTIPVSIDIGNGVAGTSCFYAWMCVGPDVTGSGDHEGCTVPFAPHLNHKLLGGRLARFRFRYVLHPFAAKYSHWMWH